MISMQGPSRRSKAPTSRTAGKKKKKKKKKSERREGEGGGGGGGDEKAERGELKELLNLHSSFIYYKLFY